MGTPEEFPLYYEMFAEVCERAGRFDEGLDAVRKGFAQAEQRRLVYWNAELHRRRGELPAGRGCTTRRQRPSASSTRWPKRGARAPRSSCCAPPPASRAAPYRGKAEDPARVPARRLRRIPARSRRARTPRGPRVARGAHDGRRPRRARHRGPPITTPEEPSATPGAPIACAPRRRHSSACGRCSPQMGITRVANVTGLDRVGIPVVMVVRPNSRSVAVSQGKGLTVAAAKASGVMEAAELWHAEHITKPLKLASYRGDARRAPGRRPGPAAPRRRRVRAGPADPLDRGQRSRRRRTGLGAASSWSARTTRCRCPPGSGCFQASSNGLASGNHPARGGLPRALRGGGARRRHALAALRRGALPPRGRPSPRSTTRSVVSCSSGSPRPTSRCASGTPPATLASRASAAWWRSGAASSPTPSTATGVIPPAKWRCCVRSPRRRRRASPTSPVRATTTPSTPGRPTYRRRRLDVLGSDLLVDTADPPTVSFDEVPSFTAPSLKDDLDWLLTRCRATGSTR